MEAMENRQSVRALAQQRSLESTDENYFVGVDIGGTSLRVALADSGGGILAKWTASTIGIREAHLVVDMIASGIDQLLLETEVPRKLLCGLGAGAPGVTDVEQGVVIATSYLMGWRNVPLRSLLESAIQIQVAVDNDVNLAALGESCCGAAQGTSDFVFLALGTGLGAGIVLNGELLRGRGWSAGEIGYMLVPGIPVEAAAHGAPGALESVIGGEGIRNQWHLLWNEGATKLPRNLVATEIFNQAIEGDRLAIRVLDETARLLAYAIYNLSLILNCPLFVLGGSVGLHPALWQATQAVLKERSVRGSPLLIPSRLGADAQLFGAIHLAVKQYDK